VTTIADVAQRAGVSISTVSYVMSGKRTISARTRERVEQAIADLAYRPHASARSLASRMTFVIGLQAPLRTGVDVNVVMEIVAGVVRTARDAEYDVLLLTSDDGDGLARAAGASRVDGLLVMDVESDDPRLATLSSLPVPTVLIGVPGEIRPGADAKSQVACVDFDFEAAGRLAAHHLADRGHRRVALLGAPQSVVTRHTSFADRLGRGFAAASAERGIVGSIHPCPAGPEAAHVVDDLLRAEPDVTGFLIHNEAAMPHLTSALSRHTSAASAGEAGSTDVGIVALCPAALAAHLPGIDAVIDIPAEQIGTRAATALLRLVSSEETEQVGLIEPQLTITTH
jgi:DNA-binding LacI/PurR family transcriptional regulator